MTGHPVVRCALGELCVVLGRSRCSHRLCKGDNRMTWAWHCAWHRFGFSASHTPAPEHRPDSRDALSDDPSLVLAPGRLDLSCPCPPWYVCHSALYALPCRDEILIAAVCLRSSLNTEGLSGRLHLPCCISFVSDVSSVRLCTPRACPHAETLTKYRAVVGTDTYRHFLVMAAPNSVGGLPLSLL
jgi:hypothetical protein